MPQRNYSSVAKPRYVRLDMTAAATTASVWTTTGHPAWPATPFVAAFERGSANEELCLVTAVSIPVGQDPEAQQHSTFTLTRGFDGTAAKPHLANAKVEHVTSAIDFRDRPHIDAGELNVGDVSLRSTRNNADAVRFGTRGSLQTINDLGATFLNDNLYHDGVDWRHRETSTLPSSRLRMSGDLLVWGTAPGGAAGSVAAVTNHLVMQNNGNVSFEGGPGPVAINDKPFHLRAVSDPYHRFKYGGGARGADWAIWEENSGMEFFSFSQTAGTPSVARTRIAEFSWDGIRFDKRLFWTNPPGSEAIYSNGGNIVARLDRAAGSAWHQAPVIVENATAEAKLTFHQPGKVASAIGQFNGSEDLRTFDNGGGGMRGFDASFFARHGARNFENNGNLTHNSWLNSPCGMFHHAADYRYLANRHSGFYEIPPGAYGMPADDWWTIVVTRHSNPNNNHGWMIASRMTATSALYINSFVSGNGTDAATVSGGVGFSGWRIVGG